MADSALGERAREIVAAPMLEFWKLAVPSMLLSGLYSVLFLVDGYFIAQLGDDSFRSLTFVTAPALVLSGMSMCINLATTRSLGVAAASVGGSTEKNDFKTQLFASLLVCATCGLGVALLTEIAGEPLLRLLGASGRELSEGFDYLRTATWAFVVQLAMSTLLTAALSIGRVRIAGIASLGALILNAVLDPVCIFILGLGIRGAVVATLVAEVAASIVLVWGLGNTVTSLWSVSERPRMTPELTRALKSVGVPAFVDYFLVSLWLFLATRLVSDIGPAAVAGYGVGIRVRQLLLATLLGLASAAMTIMSNLDGAGRLDLARSLLKNAILVGGALALLASWSLYMCADWIAPRFAQDAEVQGFAVEFLRYAQFTTPFFIMANIAARGLQGLGKGWLSTAMLVVRNTVIVGLVLLLLAGGRLGFAELWIVVGVGNAVITILNSVALERLLRRYARHEPVSMPS